MNTGTPAHYESPRATVRFLAHRICFAQIRLSSLGIKVKSDADFCSFMHQSVPAALTALAFFWPREANASQYSGDEKRPSLIIH